ncbi:MAG: hypothetical protein ACYDCI_11195 [Candidatus Limnocylindrales bacterium]
MPAVASSAFVTLATHGSHDPHAGKRGLDVLVVVAPRPFDLFGGQDERINRATQPSPHLREAIDQRVSILDVSDEKQSEIAARCATTRVGERPIGEHTVDMVTAERVREREIHQGAPIGHGVVRVAAIGLEGVLIDPAQPAYQAALLESRECRRGWRVSKARRASDLSHRERCLRVEHEHRIHTSHGLGEHDSPYFVCF